MKARSIITALYFILFSTNSLASDIVYTGGFCEFNGITINSEQNREEVFAMLLEPQDSQNFMVIGDIIGAIAVSPIKDLTNPDCKISSYTKELLEYYQKNKDAVKNNNNDIAYLLDYIQEKLKITPQQSQDCRNIATETL